MIDRQGAAARRPKESGMRRPRHLLRALATLLPLGATALAAQAPRAAQPEPPAKDYVALVASESVDRVTKIRFGPLGVKIEQEIPVGVMPTDPDGPHGVAVAPDGKTWFVSTAHGTPFGYLWKMDAVTGRVLGRVTLGSFPATVQVSPKGYLAFVVNFNLHGEMVPSSVSVVSTDEMVEVARIPTCTMPHGSRLNPQGTRHYSACMMDDMLVEIDAGTLEVSRHFMVGAGREHGMAGPPRAMRAGPGGHDQGGHGTAAHPPGDVSCSPTWAQPSADGSRVYVACNQSNDIVEVDVASWTMTRRIPAGDGVYNLAVTHDGKLLLGTNKRGQSVSVIDLASGKELARLPTRRKVVHGVVVTPDDRYAFVSVEGVGSEPGTVEIIDLRALVTVATVDVGQQAGGIDLLP
ncbi:MAG: YncE family protein [Gemmatimonadota bacterium]